MNSLTRRVRHLLCCYKVHSVIPVQGIARRLALLPFESLEFSSTAQHGPYVLVFGSSIRSALCAWPRPSWFVVPSLNCPGLNYWHANGQRSRRHGKLVLTAVAFEMEFLVRKV